MDLTQLFKAKVKTVRLRCKKMQDKNRILKAKNRDDFLLKANDVRCQVTQLRDLLIENRTAYMRFGYHLKTATQITDSERDIIDSESEKIILICNQYVGDLKENILKKNDNTKAQLTQHELAILDILTNYLENVYRLHNELKESRIRHEVETLKLSKLQTNERISNYGSDCKVALKSTGITNKNKSILETVETQKKTALSEDFEKLGDDNNVDDLQVLEFENSQLLNDFKSLTDEVEQIEIHVTGIARLQKMFTEKVICLQSCLK